MERKTSEQSLAELTLDIQKINQSLDKQQKQSESESECCACAAICGGMCLILGLAVSLLVWLVFSIVALTEVSDSTVREEYCGSLLWRYLLTMCIVLFLSHGSAAKNSNQSDEGFAAVLCSAVCGVLLHIGLATWGTYELWGRTCDNSLEDLSIYTVSLIITVYQWVLCGIVILVMLGSGIYMTCIYNPKPVKTNSLEYKPPEQKISDENV